MKLSVDDIYKYSKTNQQPLLGNTNLTFWAPYVASYAVFDRFFRDTFKSWLYWMDFDADATTAEIYADFVEAVNSHLLINQKRYTELFKVQTLAADAYDIVNNYDLTETHTNTKSESATNVSGQRTDTISNTNIAGERTDTQQGSATSGARSDSATTQAGAQVTTQEKQFEGFNSSSYQDADKVTTNAGAHSDTTNVSKGAQTDSNSSSLVKGQETDTQQGSNVKGSQTDTHTGSASENINIRRFGNIGVQTAAEIIGGHIELWDAFNFYKMIFDEIAKEYLYIW